MPNPEINSFEFAVRIHENETEHKHSLPNNYLIRNGIGLSALNS